MCAIGKSGEKTVVAKEKTYEVQENSVYHYRVHQRRAGCDRRCHSVFTLLPFLLLAAFCFARSSERLNMWFTSTKLYQDNLADYTAGRGMTKKTKVRIMSTVTLLMSIGFILMGLRGIVVGCAVLLCVWVFHLIYFVFMVKTVPSL